MSKKVIIVMCIILSMFFVSFSVAETEDNTSSLIKLDPIYVTPLRYDEFESKTPASCSVITRQDIDNSNAQTTIDLLRNQVGITVRDWTGNGTSASVDIRGFGEQAGMNVAVLVDGRKVNEVDLSAVDWTQIPIDRIQRIEVIRGGAGSVLYGDNAASGVINIITKSGKGAPYVSYEQKYGSFDMHEELFELGGKLHGLSYIFSGEHKGTHGYRNNSYFDNYDLSSKLKYEVEDDFNLNFSQSWQRAEYGLPGAVSSANIGIYDRKYSAFPEDYVKQVDYNFTGGFDKGLWGWGTVYGDVFFRRRDAYSYFPGANMGWNPITRSRIDSFGFSPKYVLGKPIFDYQNKLITGVDFFRADFNSNTCNINNNIQNYTAINKTLLGWYVQDEFQVMKNLTLAGGFRYQWTRYDFDYSIASGWGTPFDDKKETLARAYNLGAIFKYIKGGELFFNHNQSFRFPATDEYVVFGVLNTDLNDQVARNYEAGIRQRFEDYLKFEITGFWMNLKNELYYNPTGGVGGWGANENYGKTRHQGLEVSAEAVINKRILIFGNYTYTDATFREGPYQSKKIPMVPENKGSIGTRIFFPYDITLNIVGNFVDKRRFINDQINRWPALKGYFTLDANLFWKYKDLTIGTGISNIFNEKYYAYGVCNAGTGAVNYYPAAGISYFLEAKYRF